MAVGESARSLDCRMDHGPLLVAGGSEDCAGSLAGQTVASAVKAIADEQGRCSSEMASFRARLCALEERMEWTSTKVELASVLVDAPRVPMLVASEPSRPAPRLGVQIAPAPQQRASLGASQGVESMTGVQSVVETEEVSNLRRDVDALKVIQADNMNRLDAALDAARTGIARLARQVHYDREERTKALNNIKELADDIGKNVVMPTLEEAKTSLEQKIAKVIREVTTRVVSDMDTRLQLLTAELRGQLLSAPSASSTQRLPGPRAHLLDTALLEDQPVQLQEDQKPRPVSSPSVAKVGSGSTPAAPSALHQWLPEHADGDVAHTHALLMQLHVFDHIPGVSATPEQMIARPTTRFVYKVVIAIKHITGYPAGILEDWPGPPEAKLDFITKLWESISTTLGLQALEFNAKDVLHCTNRQRTRRLLQLLAIAAAKECGVATRQRTSFGGEAGVSGSQLPLSKLPERPAGDGPMSPSHATSVCWH